MGIRQLLLPAIIATFGAACASSSTPGAPGAGASPVVRESSPDFVTTTEIEATPVSNAYDLVNRLRPRWLQQQRTGSIGGGAVRNQVIVVYLDGTRIGSTDALRGMSVAGFKSMRYYDAVRAATVLRDPGTDPIAGAIVISTKAAP